VLACGIAAMDNRPDARMIAAMSGLRFLLAPLMTLVLVLAVFAGSALQGGMDHGAPRADAAHAHHAMQHMAGMAQDAEHDDARTSQAECAMAVCCFSEVAEPRAGLSCIAVTARYAPPPASGAAQPAPERADKPPRRT
jgi:hypothetical protein